MLVRRLTPVDATAYRAIMLQAYANDPAAFTTTLAEREALPRSWWTARVSDHSAPSELVLGAWVDAHLVGVAGLRFERRARTHHKATLFGIAVLSAFRRQGIARALVEAALEHAASTPGTRIVQLTVTESNDPALQLYRSCGFQPFGTEPFAIRVGDRFVSKVHMWCAVGPESPPLL